jgi:hypothetical protein
MLSHRRCARPFNLETVLRSKSYVTCEDSVLGNTVLVGEGEIEHAIVMRLECLDGSGVNVSVASLPTVLRPGCTTAAIRMGLVWSGGEQMPAVLSCLERKPVSRSREIDEAGAAR